MDNNIIDAQLEALNNSLTHFNLTGYKIYKYYQQNKRKIKSLYFLTDPKGTSLTGHWDYSQLNHFIVGYGRAVNENKYEKLKEERDLLLAASKAVLNNWDERLMGEMEVKKQHEEDFIYWSPSASLISSEFISQLREAIKRVVQ